MTDWRKIGRGGRVLLSALALTLLLTLGPPSLAVRSLHGQEETPATESGAGVNDAPVPLTFPRDDGPHAAFIEWWYYTGHLFSVAGDRYGFEFVVFKGEREQIVGYASHFAITDNARGRFAYDERLAPVEGRATAGVGGGFDISVGDWRMWGAGGTDRLVASMPDYAIALALVSTKPPVLHDGDGYIDYGSGEASYYYSRTRLDVSGSRAGDGVTVPVTGEAWMDHQWGDFTTYDEGGWDWFAFQLDDGTDLMLYVIRAPDGSPGIVDGSLVAEDGALTVLDGGDFTIESTSRWTSPETGVIYPSRWTVSIPEYDLALTVIPTLPDQELDTTASTGVIYWEGEVEVKGIHAGAAVAGLGYVELTGYANRVATDS